MKEPTEQWVVVIGSELASRPDYVVGPFDDANRAMSEGQAAADLSIGERKVYVLRTSQSLGMLADKNDREEAIAQ